MFIRTHNVYNSYNGELSLFLAAWAPEFLWVIDFINDN